MVSITLTRATVIAGRGMFAAGQRVELEEADARLLLRLGKAVPADRQERRPPTAGKKSNRRKAAKKAAA
jgi:hypothetical protein